MRPSQRRLSALAVVGVLGMPFPVAAFRAVVPAPDPAPDTFAAAVAAPALAATAAAAAPTPASPADTAAPATAPGGSATGIPATDDSIDGSSPTVTTIADQTVTGTVPGLVPVAPVPATTPAPGAPAAPAAPAVTLSVAPAVTATSATDAGGTVTATTIAGQPGAPASAAVDPTIGEVDAVVENLVDGVQLRSIVFPVAGPVTYSDDFGNCRDLCDRRHAGNDIVGLRLQPLLAAADGVVDHVVDNHPTAGWGVVVTDVEGWEYRYFHVNNDTPGTDDGLDDGTWRFAPGVGPGVAVQAGQILGWMGDSGNSESSVPHLHFEIRRPDGKAVNPFASLRWAQRLQQCLSPNGPFADMLFPIPEPSHEVELALPGGSLLIDHLGLSFPRGRAWVVGDPRFHTVDGACPGPGEIVSPPIAPTIVVPEDTAAG